MGYLSLGSGPDISIETTGPLYHIPAPLGHPHIKASKAELGEAMDGFSIVPTHHREQGPVLHEGLALGIGLVGAQYLGNVAVDVAVLDVLGTHHGKAGSPALGPPRCQLVQATMMECHGVHSVLP